MNFTERFPNEKTFVDYVSSQYDVYPLSWTTGGVAGGNCWSEGGHYSIEPEPEPEFEVLDEILLDVYPSLSFMQFRVLMRQPILEMTGFHHHEYYGNYTEGKRKSLDVPALYRALAEFES